MLGVIGALASAIPSIYRTIQGTKQMNEGRQGLAGLERPIYEMPEEVQRQLAISGAAYGDPSMPGQSMMVDRNNQTTANALAASREAGNPFASIAAIQANQQAGLQTIGYQAMQYQDQQRMQYMQQLQQVAGYRDTEWQMNKFAPYSDKYNEYRDMIGAGNKNVYSGIEGMSSVAMNVLGGIGGGSFNRGGKINNNAVKKASEKFKGNNYNDYFGEQKAANAVSGLGLGGNQFTGAAGAVGGFFGG